MNGIPTPHFDQFLNLFQNESGYSATALAVNLFNTINGWTLGLGMPIIILLIIGLMYMRSGNITTTYTMAVLAFGFVGGTVYEPMQAVLFILIGLILTAVLVMFIRGVKTN